MIDLNFKDVLGNVVKDKASDFVEDKIEKVLNIEEPKDFTIHDPSLDTESASINYHHSNNEFSTESLERARSKSEELIQKVDASNIFTLPSIITVLFFLLSTVYLDLDAALADNKLSLRESLKLLYLGLGGVATLVARYNDPKKDVYTPHYVLGKDKEDFIDLNHNSVDDRYE